MKNDAGVLKWLENIVRDLIFVVHITADHLIG